MSKYFIQSGLPISRYASHLNQSVSILSQPRFQSINTQQITSTSDLTIATASAKTMVLTQPVYNDINLGINPRNVGAGRPTLTTFKGNISEFQFAVGNYADFQPFELLHDWREGTEIEIHLHWALASANDGTVRGVKWSVEYTYADFGGTFVANDTQSKETSIIANEPAYTHKYTSIFTLTPAVKIGTQFCVRLTRIASVVDVAPASDPFVFSFGIHYMIDTMGSRQRGTK